MNAVRAARMASTVAVASIAAWSSYSHMVHVALRYGERPEVAYVLPISVDGMLLVASTVMVDDKRAGGAVRWSARVAFTAGVAASVAANIAAGQPTLGARIVAAWPAVALLLVVEMLSRSRGPEASDQTVASPDTEQKPPPVSTSQSQSPTRPRRRSAAQTTADIADIRAQRPDASAAEIAVALGLSERHVRRLTNAGLGPVPSVQPQPNVRGSRVGQAPTILEG